MNAFNSSNHNHENDSNLEDEGRDLNKRKRKSFRHPSGRWSEKFYNVKGKPELRCIISSRSWRHEVSPQSQVRTLELNIIRTTYISNSLSNRPVWWVTELLIGALPKAELELRDHTSLSRFSKHGTDELNNTLDFNLQLIMSHWQKHSHGTQCWMW